MITILGNLIDNAFDAVKDRHNKQVTFFVTDLGNDIIFEVTDNGKGIPDAIQEQIFEKGFSTKQGTDRGYGLSIVEETVQELNGSIELQSSEEGTTFTVYLPKREEV